MKLRFLVPAIGAAVTLSTASAASLNLASQDLTVIRTCVLTAYPSSATVETNAWVGSGNGYGVSPLDVRSYKSTGDQRTFVSFDLTACSPTIPSTATVRAATLVLYLQTLNMTAGACRTDDAFAVTAGWTQSGPGHINWSNQPFGTGLDNPPSASASAQMQVGPGCSTNHATGYVSGWDVTADVQSFVTGSATNDGWMIRDDQEGSGTQEQAVYTGRGAGSAPHAPRLIVSYVDVP